LWQRLEQPLGEQVRLRLVSEVKEEGRQVQVGQRWELAQQPQILEPLLLLAKSAADGQPPERVPAFELEQLQGT